MGTERKIKFIPLTVHFVLKVNFASVAIVMNVTIYFLKLVLTHIS